jgi:hypothetical protein
MYMNGQGGIDFTITQQFYSIKELFDQARFEKVVKGHFGATFENLEVAHVHYCKLLLEGVFEAPLGDATLKRHLPALEPWRGAAAGTGILALGATSGSLPKAGARSTPDALFGLLCSWSGSQIVKSHGNTCSICMIKTIFKELSLSHLDEMNHFANGANDGWSAVEINRLIESGESESLQDRPVFFRAADGASDQLDLYGLCHVQFL